MICEAGLGSLTDLSTFATTFSGAVAQLVEHRTENP